MLAGWAAGRPPRKAPPEERRDGTPESDRSANGASRLFAEGQAGNIVLADDIFSEGAGANGVVVGVAGPKRRLPERLAGFPELSIHIVDMFSAGDKICYASRLARTRACPYRCRGGRPAGGRCGLCCWCFEAGKVAEISTIQDRFTPLKQISCLPRRDLCGVGCASRRAGSPEGTRCGPHLHRKPYTSFRLCLPPGPASRGCLAMAAVGGNELLTSFRAEGFRSSLRRS